MSSIVELMRRDPLDHTKEDLDAVVAFLRQDRLALADSKKKQQVTVTDKNKRTSKISSAELASLLGDDPLV